MIKPDPLDMKSYFSRLFAASEIISSQEKNDQNSAENEGPSYSDCENMVPYKPQEKLLNLNQLEGVIKRLHSLTNTQMKNLLLKAELPTQGTRKKLRQRLNTFCRKEFGVQTVKERVISGGNRTARHFDYLVVIDLEATCDETCNSPHVVYPHEIIEFPAVLIDVKTMKIIDKFRTFVRPTLHPLIPQFCLDFCHLTQTTVNEAPTFPEAYMNFLHWLQKHSLGQQGRRYAFVTDGPHDFCKFLQYQGMLCGWKTSPHQFRHWINVKSLFKQRTKCTIEKRVNQIGKTAIQQMLEHYGLDLGLAHSGLEDAISIAKITIEMMRRDNCELRINEGLRRNVTKSERDQEDPWFDMLPLKLVWVRKEEFFSGEYLDCDSCDEDDD